MKILLKPNLLLLLLLILFAVSASYGQYCSGYTEYKIKRPNGAFLKKNRLEKFRIVEIDGQKHNLEFKDNVALVGYQYRGKLRQFALSIKKTVTLDFYKCGQIESAILEYDGKRMLLNFNIGIHNTNFSIGSLPFQEGFFKLTSLACENKDRPPRIDNENSGICNVPATKWIKLRTSKRNAPLDSALDADFEDGG